jgi:hypothetical protein
MLQELKGGTLYMYMEWFKQKQKPLYSKLCNSGKFGRASVIAKKKQDRQA